MADVLTQEQLADDLFKGLGRPYLYFQTHDSSPYRETLLSACIYNPVYDRQCEGTRTAYLYELVQLTGQEAWFAEHLLATLAVPADHVDFPQLFEFALHFAQAGHPRARQLLYEQAGTYASEGDIVGAAQLLALDGLAGFLFLARRLGVALTQGIDLWQGDYLLSEIEQRLDTNQLRTELARARAEDPFIALYLDTVDQVRAEPKTSSEERRRFIAQPYAELKHVLLDTSKSKAGVWLQQWGQAAAQDDLQRAAEDLLVQTLPASLIGYLRIFHRQPFPLGSAPLVPLAGHADEGVAHAAIEALTLFQHITVRNLALHLIEAKQHALEAINLLARNYAPGDEQMLMTLLDTLDDQDAVHTFSFSVEAIVAHNPSANTGALLLALYERGPCSICRKTIVELLLDRGQLPEHLVLECLHDANEGTREVIQRHVAGDKQAVDTEL